MPAYCCALNCKNNGFTNPELSFFKFPVNRSSILEQWVKALRRESSWKPTVHSRLCSIHFSESSFFMKRGSRLRILNDAIPSIFDFRKISSNRKKADTNTINEDLVETDCPDPDLYEMVTESVAEAVKCFLCQEDVCESNLDFNYPIETKVGIFSIEHIISKISSRATSITEERRKFCKNCMKKLKTSYEVKLDLEATAENRNDPLQISSLESNVKDNNQPIFCEKCVVSFDRSQLGDHLKSCLMRREAEVEQILVNSRKLLVCYFCRTLIYEHNSGKHFDECRHSRNQ